MNSFVFKTSTLNQSLYPRILLLINFNHVQYCEHQFTNYESFANLYFHDDAVTGVAVRYSTLFRTFWNEEWEKRNKSEFLPFSEACCLPSSSIINEYVFIHSPERLLNAKGFINRFETLLKLIQK